MPIVPLALHGDTKGDGTIEKRSCFEAAYVGLRNFLRALAVDRQQVKVQKNRVIVRLFYTV